MSEERSVFLHIGPHKTGSTFIQKNLYLNKEKLLEIGYLYPEPQEIIPEYSVFCHYELHNSPKKIKELVSKNDKNHNIIISFEGLSLYDVEQIKTLKKCLDELGYEHVKIIFFVRHPIKRLYSLWQEKIKHGGLESFSSFLIKNISQPFLNDNLNYDLILAKWMNFFNIKNLILINYDKCINIFMDFLKALSIKDISIFTIEERIINKSLQLERAEILRSLNNFAKIDNLLINNNITRIFFKLLKENKEFVELVKTLSESLRKFIFEITIGKIYLSNLHNIIKSKYCNNFINEFEEWEILPLKVIDEIWLFNEDLFKLSKEIYLTCKSFYNNY